MESRMGQLFSLYRHLKNYIFFLSLASGPVFFLVLVPTDDNYLNFTILLLLLLPLLSQPIIIFLRVCVYLFFECRSFFSFNVSRNAAIKQLLSG